MTACMPLFSRIITESRQILGDSLVGIYLHGSAAMGCFHPKVSDLDLLITVEDALSDNTRRAFMDSIVRLNQEAPAKGIELSILRKSVCRPLLCPTPFELHFSPAHLVRYQKDPEEYIRVMRGTDRDLPAHIMVLRSRGSVLFGKPVAEVFGEVSREDYLDSVLYDLASCEEEILQNPMYVILNLCRTAAYLETGRIFSKKEGGEWGLSFLPEPYHDLIAAALCQYAGGEAPYSGRDLCLEFSSCMLAQIRSRLIHR